MRRPIGLAFGVTALVLLSASAHAACPAGAISLPVGSNIGQRAHTAPEGAVFCIRAGIHRLQRVQPRDRQRFYGEPGAIMNGSQRITRFEREGVYWVATGQTQRGIRHATQECLPSRPRCSYPEAFFINNVPLLSVASKAAVKPGTFLLRLRARPNLFPRQSDRQDRGGERAALRLRRRRARRADQGAHRREILDADPGRRDRQQHRAERLDHPPQ